jgi:pyruvate-formate lyase-activating enzyme
MKCKLIAQGYKHGACETRMPDGTYKRACEATLRRDDNMWYRVIEAAHLSRPEHYFSIYMSGCNLSCKKCHSAEFTKQFSGSWLSTQEIAELCVTYAKDITVEEPVERALDWYATELCKCCGACILTGKRSERCPNKLDVEQIIWSPQGWGPARNIVGYTGGDLGCQAEFYADLTVEIKSHCKNLHVLFETNGYGLTPANLDLLKSAGVDSFWLDIKAYDRKTHEKLCGKSNEYILQVPTEIIDRKFQLEILSLYIPGLVEQDQLCQIAKLIVELDPKLPFTLLAFFPAHQMRNYRAPTVIEMLQTYLAIKDLGLKNVRLGNTGVFARTREELNLLSAVVQNGRF